MQGRIISKFNFTLFFLLLTSCGGGGGDLPATPTEDKTSPDIIETIPSSEQAGILPTDSIKVTFNESLKPLNSYITNEQVVVYLINDITGVRVEPAIQLDETLFYLETKNTKNDVLIVPFINTNDLKASSQYQVAIKSIKDLSNNVMLGTCTWGFTTGENGLVTKKITLGKTGLCGTQPIINIPNQAENVQAFSINETTILVNWTAPKTGSRVDYYQIERSIERVVGEQTSFEILKQFTSELSYLDPTAEPNRKHTYKITAANDYAGFATLSALSNPVIPKAGQQIIKPSQVLLPENPLDAKNFGSNFKFSPKGTTLAIADFSASIGTNPIITNAGIVHLYNKTTSGWVNTISIISRAPKQDGWFGSLLRFSPDGQILAIQERFSDVNNVTVIKNAGSVQLFAKTENTWSY